MDTKYNSIPSHVFNQIDLISWDNVISLSPSYSPDVRGKSSHIKKLAAEMSLSRLLLTEKARLQEKEGKLDPKIFMELVKLHELGQKMEAQYDVNMHGFNSFLYLLIQKAKKQKLARHEPGLSEYTSIQPISESNFAKFKSISEKKKKK